VPLVCGTEGRGFEHHHLPFYKKPFYSSKSLMFSRNPTKLGGGFWSVNGAGPLGKYAYGPSKTALNDYTIVLAYELKDTPFKVNAVDPGYTDTDFNNHMGKGSVVNPAAIIVK